MNRTIKVQLGNETITLNAENRVLYVTGAGISVDSNLPTYRGNGGLYDGKEGKIERLLSDHNMRHKPGVIWDHIFSGIEKIETFEPNIAHTTIAKMQDVLLESCVFTQQVDNLHQKAGSVNVIDIHGNATQAFCKNCIAVRGESLAFVPMKDIDFSIKTKKGCPACSFCKSDLRPDIVPFGGMLDMNKYNQLIDFIIKPVDVVFVVGTSLQFPHIYEPVIECELNHGSKVIYIDPSDNCEPFFLSGIKFEHVRKTATEFFADNVKIQD